MTKTEYAAYLQGNHWRGFRSEYLQKWQWCARCDMPRWLAEIVYDQDLNVHHRSYERLGNESEFDVEALCRRCHEIETFGRSELKLPKKATCTMCGEAHWNYRSDHCHFCLLTMQGVFTQFLDKPHPESGKNMRLWIAEMLIFGGGKYAENAAEVIEGIGGMLRRLSRMTARTAAPKGEIE